MTSNGSHRYRPAALIVLAGAVVAGSLLGGCGGSTPEEEAINQASATLHGLGVSGSLPMPSVEDRRKRYTQIVSSLTPIATGQGAGGAQAEAASAMLAQAQSGLAEIASRDVLEAEQAALGKIIAIRAAFDQWLSQKAVADSLRAYDPAPELAKLDEEIARRQAEAAHAAEDKQKQEALVAKTRQQAEQARSQVEAFRSQEASIRAGAAGASETAKAAALEQALAVKRQGDEYEKQAAGFEAVAASQAPEVVTIQSQIDKLNRQVELLRDAKKSLLARAEASKAQAAAASEEANAGSKRVSELVTELDAARARVPELTEAAAKQYKAAVGSAKKSGSGTNRDAANMAAGNYEQSLGDLLAGRARGLSAYATVMKTLSAGGQPGVTPAMASEAQKAADDALAEAQETYRQAISSFEGVRGSPEAREKIERLVAKVRSIAGEVPAPAPAESEAAPADGATPVEKPAAGEGEPAADFDAAAVEAEVRAALGEMKADAERPGVDPAALMDKWVTVSNPAAREVVDLMSDLVRKQTALDEACTAKFGKGLQALIQETKNASVQSSPMFGMLSQVSDQVGAQFKNFDPAQAQVEATSAAAARVAMPDSPERIDMAKVDGLWKISMDAMLGGPAAAMMKGPVTAFGAVFDTITGKINSGAFSDADTMLLDLNKELMIAIQKAMPMGQPGGGAPDGGDK
jgi:hypothetical protein